LKNISEPTLPEMDAPVARFRSALSAEKHNHIIYLYGRSKGKQATPRVRAANLAASF
jgi:hypothetical protein